MRNRAALVCALLVSAVALAGCGSDDPTVSPEAAVWADGYCTAVTSLYTPIAAAASAILAGDVTTAAQAMDVFAPVTAAASAFAKDIAALTPPDTEGGAQAKEQTDQLAATVEKYVARGTAAIDGWESGKVTQASALSTIGSELRATKQEVGQTTAAVRNLDTELNAAINDSQTCQSLIDTLESEPTS